MVVSSALTTQQTIGMVAHLVGEAMVEVDLPRVLWEGSMALAADTRIHSLMGEAVARAQDTIAATIACTLSSRHNSTSSPTIRISRQPRRISLPKVKMSALWI